MLDLGVSRLGQSSCNQTPVTGVRRPLDAEDYGCIVLPKCSYKVIPIERLGVSLLIRGNEGWCERLALSLGRADRGIGELLELARVSAGGQITNVQIVDPSCRELGLKPACVGE